jgi:hypothetical protein
MTSDLHYFSCLCQFGHQCEKWSQTNALGGIRTTQFPIFGNTKANCEDYCSEFQVDFELSLNIDC